MHLKSIIYAYAHSADARRFGYALSGCWTLNLRKDNQPPQALSGFETYGEALKVADAMGEEFDPVHHAPNPEEIRTAPQHSAAVLIRRQHRAPASLGGMHYFLEKGERVRIQRVNDTHATCYLGEPAERRISEDYFPVPIDALKLLYRAPQGEDPERQEQEKIATLNETFDRIAAERDKELAEEKRAPRFCLTMATPDDECNHSETACCKSACFVQMTNHLFATFGAIEAEVWEAFAALENGEDSYRREDFSTPESNFTFTMEEVQP